MSELIEQLNRQFAITGQLRIVAGQNGLPVVQVSNAMATAEIYLLGGHITSFCPVGQKEVLWMSPLAQYQVGRAIRGGVPVIWPWFGPHATDSQKPQHGFARTSEWSLISTEALTDGSTQLSLQLTDDASTQALWPYAFELTLTVTVGTELKIDLISRNVSEQTVVTGGALHSYFNLGDVSTMFVEGLDGCEYIDQVDGNQHKQQNGNVRITQETDRIYVSTKADCVIHDAAFSRQIHVQKRGSRSTVVWNPWQDKAGAMADFVDDGYQHMVCIEAANAAEDVVQLAPGKTHTLSQIISVVNER